MPHLDLTYFFEQSLWCIFIFLLIYFTVSKAFYTKYSGIMTERQEFLCNRANESNEILVKVNLIKKQLDKSKQSLESKLKINEEILRKKIYHDRIELLKSFKKEMNDKKSKYQSSLDSIELRFMENLLEYSSSIEAEIHVHLFGK